MPVIKEKIETFIPEELVILNQLISQHGLQEELSGLIENYVDSNLEDMDLHELSKLYVSCQKHLALTPSFISKLSTLLLERFPKA